MGLFQSERTDRTNKTATDARDSWLLLHCYPEKPVAVSIGAVLRNTAHDRMLTKLAPFSRDVRDALCSRRLSDLSDYEYFCLLARFAPTWSDTWIGKVDAELLKNGFGTQKRLAPETCDAVWQECYETLRYEKTADYVAENMDLYCYFVSYVELCDHCETLAKAEQEIRDSVALLPSVSCESGRLAILSEKMPAVFTRPDPYHAELSYRKLRLGKAKPEDICIVYSQLLRTLARACVKHHIPLLLDTISPDFASYSSYAEAEANGVRILARIDENSFHWLDGTSAVPVLSDVYTAERVSSFLPLTGTVFIPGPSDADPRFLLAVQRCFRRELAHYYMEKGRSSDAIAGLIRTICLDNLALLCN